jgi:hypothetical protein
MGHSNDIGFTSSNDMSLYSLMRQVKQSKDSLSGPATWESPSSISSFIPLEQGKVGQSLQDIIREALEFSSDITSEDSKRHHHSNLAKKQ